MSDRALTYADDTRFQDWPAQPTTVQAHEPEMEEPIGPVLGLGLALVMSAVLWTGLWTLAWHLLG